jgi:hypothetical protein
MWQVLDTYSHELADGYREEAAAQALSAEQQRSALFQALFEGHLAATNPPANWPTTSEHVIWIIHDTACGRTLGKPPQRSPRSSGNAGRVRAATAQHK